MKNRVAVSFVAVFTVLMFTSLAHADRLDGQLNNKMQDLVFQLKSKYKSIGVLRFRVDCGTGKDSFASPLSGRMVERLETLVMLHNGPNEAEALQLVHDVPRVAARNGIDDWFGNVEQRRQLFSLSYPRAWGDQKLKPEAFLTGKVSLSRNHRTTIVELELFDRDHPEKLIRLAKIEMPTDRFVLRDLGYGFRLSKQGRTQLVAKRSLSDEDAVLVYDIIQQANDKTTLLTPSDIGGIRFEMQANRKPLEFQSIENPDSPIRWQVSCPPPDSEVHFLLKNTTTKRLAVVLRLNGFSTINDQTLDPENAAKWVLEPGKLYRLEGTFLLPTGPVKRHDDGLIQHSDDDEDENDTITKGGNKYRPFRVLIGEEANQMKQQLGDKAGVIDIDVFEAGLEKEEEETLITLRGLKASKEKLARATYSRLQGSLVKNNQLQVKFVEEKKDNDLVVKKSLLVPDEKALQSSRKIKLTDFPNSQLTARLSIQIVPANDLATKNND